MLTRVALVLLLAGGCHHDQPVTGPTPPAGGSGSASSSGSSGSDAAPATVVDAVAEGMHMLSTAALSVVLGGNCAAQAAGLQAWSDNHRDLMAKVREDLHKWPQADVVAAVHDQLPKHPEVKPLFDAATTCANDAAFAASWNQIYAAMQ